MGVVLRLDDLAVRDTTSAAVHDRFLAHPAIAPLLRGGEVLEYGAHLTIENGPSMVCGDLSRPGLLLVGDAGGFTLNTGLTIRGMDLAAGSALAAAATVHDALDHGDVSGPAMAQYRKRLAADFVGADMATYSKAPAFLENPRLYKDYGLLLAEILHQVYGMDLTPRRHLVPTALTALRRSGISMTRLARDGISAVRAL